MPEHTRQLKEKPMKNNQPKRTTGRPPSVGRAVTAMAATLLILAACGNDGSSDPAAVVEGYVAAYNAGDVDAVVAFYVEDAVITGHPFATRTQGSGAIRDLMVRDIAASDKSGESYEVSNVQVKGDTVTWEHLWKSGAGIECVGTGNNAEVLDGKIASYTFAPDVDCS